MSSQNDVTATHTGVFDAQTNLFAGYAARIVFEDRVIGGVPRDPKLIEGWLRTRAGLQDVQEVRQAMLRTLGELGVDVRADMSFDDLVRASEAVASTKQTTGFKVGEQGLYLEARQIKAMLKESTNVLFGGERWGATKKGPRHFVAERVFVEPDKIWLGVREPTGIELMIGHITGPTGPHSTVGYHEYVTGAQLDFRVLVVHDCLSGDQWADIWVHAQQSGLGALRSQGFGRFRLLRWDRL